MERSYQDGNQLDAQNGTLQFGVLVEKLPHTSETVDMFPTTIWTYELRA